MLNIFRKATIKKPAESSALFNNISFTHFRKVYTKSQLLRSYIINLNIVIKGSKV